MSMDLSEIKIGPYVDAGPERQVAEVITNDGPLILDFGTFDTPFRLIRKDRGFAIQCEPSKQQMAKVRHMDIHVNHHLPHNEGVWVPIAYGRDGVLTMDIQGTTGTGEDEVVPALPFNKGGSLSVRFLHWRESDRSGMSMYVHKIKAEPVRFVILDQLDMSKISVGKLWKSKKREWALIYHDDRCIVLNLQVVRSAFEDIVELKIPDSVWCTLSPEKLGMLFDLGRRIDGLCKEHEDPRLRTLANGCIQIPRFSQDADDVRIIFNRHMAKRLQSAPGVRCMLKVHLWLDFSHSSIVIRATELNVPPPYIMHDINTAGADHGESGCQICGNDFGKMEQCAMTECRHAFHRECISECISESGRKCPICENVI